VRFNGVVESIDGSTWMVSGAPSPVQIVDGVTVFEGDAKLGARVWVVAEWHDGTLVATKITVEAEAPAPYDCDFSGIINSIQGTTWTIGGETYEVPAGGVGGDAPQAGCVAHVQALCRADRGVRVESIGVECGYWVEFEGTIESIGNRWRVSGTTVIVQWASIVGAQAQVGLKAEVRGYMRGGSVVATLITVMAPEPTATATASPSPEPTSTPTAMPTSEPLPTETPLPSPTEAEPAPPTPSSTPTPTEGGATSVSLQRPR
jgi:hypothetical protein